MPNRILKDSIRESDSIDSLSWFQEVLFYRLIVSCDDYGRFDGRISVIKNRLFPLKDGLTQRNVADGIQKLVSAGLVILYENDGKPFLYLPTWTVHQNVRAKRSKYPDPAEPGSSVKASASTCMQNNADEHNGKYLQENVPVIQSNTISESVSESVSISESESESFSGGGDCARASESELFQIGLTSAEWGHITRELVQKTIDNAEELFRKWRPTVNPNTLDRRMVFRCSDSEGNADLLDYAFEQAYTAGKVGDWRYIDGIIQVLRHRGIQTLEQAREWDQERPDREGNSLDTMVKNMLENRGRKKGAGI